MDPEEDDFFITENRKADNFPQHSLKKKIHDELVRNYLLITQ